MSKLTKGLTIILASSLILGILGGGAFAFTKEDYTRDILITIPENWYWQEDKTLKELYQECGVGTAHGSNWNDWAARYFVATFLMKHPRVMFDFENIWPYGTLKKEKLMTSLAAGEAPAYWPLGLLTGDAEGDILEGYAADITDLVKEWDKTTYLKEKRWALWQPAWVEGKCYGIPDWMCAGLTWIYRKDYFHEAGIFNEQGEPGPPFDWTIGDFEDMCLKLTDPKKKRWAFSMNSPKRYSERYERTWFNNFGVPRVIPDQSGKYTWKSGLHLPQAKAIYELWHRLVFEQKSVLVGPAGEEGDDRAQFATGRVAMMLWGSWSSVLTRAGQSQTIGPHVFHLEGTPEDMAFGKVAGMVPWPKGSTGIRVSSLSGSLYGFDPTLDKDHLEAAFQYFTYSPQGGGEGFDIFWRGMKMAIGSCDAPYTFSYPTPDFMRGVYDICGPEWTNNIDLETILPVMPRAAAFGLPVNLGDGMYSLLDRVLHEPDLDLDKAIAEAADRIDAGVLDYKVPDTTKDNYRRYYSALADFYKEYFPEHLPVFQEMLEKYFKVW